MRFFLSLSALTFSNLSNNYLVLEKVKSYIVNDNAQPINVHQRETKINAPMYFSNDGEGSRGEITTRKTLRVPSNATRIQMNA
jgi:hypothetical protein